MADHHTVTVVLPLDASPEVRQTLELLQALVARDQREGKKTTIKIKDSRYITQSEITTFLQGMGHDARAARNLMGRMLGAIITAKRNDDRTLQITLVCDKCKGWCDDEQNHCTCVERFQLNIQRPHWMLDVQSLKQSRPSIANGAGAGLLGKRLRPLFIALIDSL